MKLLHNIKCILYAVIIKYLKLNTLKHWKYRWYMIEMHKIQANKFLKELKHYARENLIFKYDY